MHDHEYGARNWALRALEGSTAPEADSARRLILLNERESSLREVALEQLAKRHDTADVPLIRSALRDPASGVRGGAIEGAGSFDSAGARVAAREMLLSDPNSSVREHADHRPESRRPRHAGPVARPDGARVAGGASPDGGLPDPEPARSPGRRRPHRVHGAVRNEIPSAGEPSLPRGPERQGARDRHGHQVPRRPDPLFAVSAVQTLARIGGPAGKATLQQRLPVEKRVTVSSAIRQALAPKQSGRTGGPRWISRPSGGSRPKWVPASACSGPADRPKACRLRMADATLVPFSLLGVASRSTGR